MLQFNLFFTWGGGYLLEEYLFIYKIFYENQEFLYNLSLFAKNKKNCLLDATHTATTPALLLP